TRFSRDWSSDVCSSDLKSSMVVIGAYNTFVAEERGIDFGMAGIPRPDGYPIRTPLTLGWGYGIPVNADHPQEAWLLLKFLTLDEIGRASCRERVWIARV